MVSFISIAVSVVILCFSILNKAIFKNSFSSIPFSHHTAMEYFLLILSDVSFAAVYLIVTVTVLTFFLNCCLLLESHYLHIKTMFTDIDVNQIQSHAQRSSKTTTLFIQAIKLHFEITKYARVAQM